MLSQYFRYISLTEIMSIFALTLSLGMLPAQALADTGDDDVAALVVDNGEPVSVQEPSTLLLLGGELLALHSGERNHGAIEYVAFCATTGHFSSLSSHVPAAHPAKRLFPGPPVQASLV